MSCDFYKLFLFFFFGVFRIYLIRCFYSVDRTNNLIERYNRHFHTCFPSKRPSLPAYVALLKKESERLVRYKRDVERGHAEPGERAPIDWPVIPQAYIEFCPYVASATMNESPSKCTRSALKRYRATEAKRRSVVAKKAKLREYPQKR